MRQSQNQRSFEQKSVLQLVVIFSGEYSRARVVRRTRHLHNDCRIVVSLSTTGAGQCCDNAARVQASRGGALELPLLTDVDLSSGVLDGYTRGDTGPSRCSINLLTVRTTVQFPVKSTPRQTYV